MILKQMMEIERNGIKNPNWREAAQVGYLQALPRIWTRDDREQFQQVARAGESNPGPPDCEADVLTTRPRCLLIQILTKEEYFVIVTIIFGHLGDFQALYKKTCVGVKVIFLT